MADPGTGKIRFNNATLSSVTAIAISKLPNNTGNPRDEKGALVETVKIFVQEKEWNFWLTQVGALTGTNYSWLTLANLFPRELRLSGPEQLVARR